MEQDDHNDGILSIVVPGIHTSKWPALYKSVQEATRDIPSEVIFVGPNELPTELLQYPNVRYYYDAGSPARSLQIGVVKSRYKLHTWLSDDLLVTPDGLRDEVNFLLQKDRKTILNLNYTEGEEYKYGRDPRQQDPDTFYTAYTHNDLRLPGVRPGWVAGNYYIMYTDYLIELGGYDCRFECVNFNQHDMTFRAQKDGATFIKYLTRGKFFAHLECVYGRTPETSPIIAAYTYNDLPLFKRLWADDSRPIKIPLDNWKDSPEVWSRRVGAAV